MWMLHEVFAMPTHYIIYVSQTKRKTANYWQKSCWAVTSDNRQTRQKHEEWWHYFSHHLETEKSDAVSKQLSRGNTL